MDFTEGQFIKNNDPYPGEGVMKIAKINQKEKMLYCELERYDFDPDFKHMLSFEETIFYSEVKQHINPETGELYYK